MELSHETFDELRRLIHRLCGIVLSDDKTYLVKHRLEPLVRRAVAAASNSSSRNWWAAKAWRCRKPSSRR